MILKPQDILVLLKILAVGKTAWAYNTLALELNMSPSEVHAAIQRATASRLAVKEPHGIRPNISRLEEFLLHGIQYVFVPKRGELTRGMPTAHAAPPLAEFFTTPKEPPPVWPDPNGNERGFAFSPLYRSVPQAARKDSQLYELLVLVDALRSGRAREREIAADQLVGRLRKYESLMNANDESKS